MNSRESSRVRSSFPSYQSTTNRPSNNPQSVRFNFSTIQLLDSSTTTSSAELEMPQYCETSPDILVELKKSSLIDFLNVLKEELPHKIRQYNYLLCYLSHYETLNKNRHQIASDRWNVRFYGHRYGKRENCTIVTITKSRVSLENYLLNQIYVKY